MVKKAEAMMEHSNNTVGATSLWTLRLMVVAFLLASSAERRTLHSFATLLHGMAISGRVAKGMLAAFHDRLRRKGVALLRDKQPDANRQELLTDVLGFHVGSAGESC